MLKTTPPSKYLRRSWTIWSESKSLWSHGTLIGSQTCVPSHFTKKYVLYSVLLDFFAQHDRVHERTCVGGRYTKNTAHHQRRML